VRVIAGNRMRQRDRQVKQVTSKIHELPIAGALEKSLRRYVVAVPVRKLLSPQFFRKRAVAFLAPKLYYISPKKPIKNHHFLSKKSGT
jgi:hypothetical protein